MLSIGGTSVAELAALTRAMVGIQQAGPMILGQKNVWPEAIAWAASPSPVKCFPRSAVWGRLGGATNMTQRDVTISGFYEQRRPMAGILGDQSMQVFSAALYGVLVLDTIDINQITSPDGPGMVDVRFNIDGRMDFGLAEGDSRTDVVLQAPWVAQITLTTASLVYTPE